MKPNIFGTPTARAQQSTDTNLWWPDTSFPCGRCQATCHQFYAFIEWPGYEPTLLTSLLPQRPTLSVFTPARALPLDLNPLLPREDFRGLFDNILLTREPLLNPLDPVPAPIELGYDWTVRYNRCNWRTPQVSAFETPLINLRWYLYYGDTYYDYEKYNDWARRSNNGMLVVSVPHLLPTRNVANPFDWDGLLSEEPVPYPPLVQGWTIALVQEKIVPSLTVPDLATVHRHWAIFTLNKIGPAYTVFKCQEHNVFVQADTPDIFPQFLIHLVPANHS